MIPLGHILDGLIVFYNAYKNSKIPPISQSLSDLKKNLKAIYELLPPPCQMEYRKKRLKNREEDLKWMEESAQHILLQKTKESIAITAEIYQNVLNLKGYHSTLFDLGRILGSNVELAKYLFHEIAKNEEKIVILEIITCNKTRDFLLLDQYPLLFGRCSSPEKNIFVVRDFLVSKIHCRLMKEGSSILLEDFHSRNGTYINGNMIRGGKALLKSEDKIRIGNSKIHIQIMNQEEIEGTFETKIHTFTFSRFSLQDITLITLVILLIFLLILVWITFP